MCAGPIRPPDRLENRIGKELGLRKTVLTPRDHFIAAGNDVAHSYGSGSRPVVDSDDRLRSRL